MASAPPWRSCWRRWKAGGAGPRRCELRCTIVAIGPRGDVQPLLALGAGLRERGLDVRIASHADFQPAVEAHGLAFTDVGGDASAFFGGAAGAAIRDRLADARAFQRFFDDYLSLFFEKLLSGVSEACRDADAVLCWPWTRFAPSLAEALRVPVFVVCTYPPLHLPTAAFANPYQPDRSGVLSPRRTWRLSLPALQAGDGVLNRWRVRALGLRAVGWRQDLRALRRLPHLLGFSPAVLPPPPDWPASVEVTGHWFLDEPGYQPPSDLAAFLEGGDAVAIGFSSQVTRNQRAFTATIQDGLRRSGARAIVLGGFGAVSQIERSDRIFTTRSVPYDWLFRRVRAVVHHGGAGSTMGALRAGLPNAAIPFGYDQPLWAERLHALGVSPPPTPAAELTSSSLASIIGALVDSSAMRDRARTVGDIVSQEDGVGRAVDAVMRALERRQS